VYCFQHDDGSYQTLKEEIWIARPNASNDKLPSCLGWNVLQHFKLTADGLGQRFVLE
jgi:hypothetical protein